MGLGGPKRPGAIRLTIPFVFLGAGLSTNLTPLGDTMEAGRHPKRVLSVGISIPRTLLLLVYCLGVRDRSVISTDLAELGCIFLRLDFLYFINLN